MRRVVASVLVCASIAGLFPVSGEPSSDTYKTLALLDSHSIEESHSQFFQALQENGHEVTFSLASASSLRLRNYDQWLFDNVIVFAPTSTLKGHVSPSRLAEFVDAGRNLLIAGGTKMSKSFRELAKQMGMRFDKSKSRVMDHFNFDAVSDTGAHSWVLTDNWIRNAAVLGDALGAASGPVAADFATSSTSDGSDAAAVAPLLFRGVGLHVSERAQFVFPVLRGGATAYSAPPRIHTAKALQSTGADTKLVMALQARNNARVSVSGSLDMFSDRFFDAAVENSISGARFAQSSNRAFCDNLATWTFGQRGLLRAVNVTHKQVAHGDATEATFSVSETNPEVYRLKDWVEYTVELQEFNWQSGGWIPFVADDVQLEFVRMDPFELRNLEHDSQGHYSLQFQVPDVFGAYQFRVDYKRIGFGYIWDSRNVAVRPFFHNEYERFIGSALPYYVGGFSCMAAIMLFSSLYLYRVPDP